MHRIEISYKRGDNTMDALLNGLNCNYQVDDLIIKDSTAVFKISSKLHEIECVADGLICPEISG
jgi:hypothetical protein